jgi:putative ABC transport system ATP-binding protein
MTTSDAAVLQVRGLVKRYGEGRGAITAVAGVDLDAAAGEVVLVTGPSGSGKSTLLLCIAAMLRPDSGTVLVNGLDVTALSERRLPRVRANHLGFIFQDFALLASLTTVENVELACNLAGKTSRVARDRAVSLLERVGLGDRLTHRPAELSGGEQQRVAIARALANGPELILADEPTANLDSGMGREVGRLLHELAVHDGRAVVIVSHDSRLREFAHRVLWLEDGAFQSLAAMVVDPVCGMSVEPHDNPHLVDGGATWWFCSTGCRDEFQQSPNRFTETAASTTHT